VRVGWGLPHEYIDFMSGHEEQSHSVAVMDRYILCLAMKYQPCLAVPSRAYCFSLLSLVPVIACFYLRNSAKERNELGK